MQVHLIDGTYELFRMFYGAPSSVNPAGREVGAVEALLNSFSMLVRNDDVTHVAVAFDHVIESFRNELFDGYKTGEGIDPQLSGQFHLAEDACRALGLVVWPMVEFEADDALATAAARFHADPRVDRVVIGSPDKDLCQCVRGKEVITWDRRRQKVFDEAGVLEKHGVPPASIPDFLALVGAAADGIPGIPRWGAKGTALVLRRYGSLENIPLDHERWDIKVRGGATLAKNLSHQLDDARLYKQLATLREDVPLAEELDALEYRGADREAFAKLDGVIRTARASIPRWR
ncbi:MAG TPA: flap endonuclease [Polyangiaceae bacterium]|nr:flap endonuclease [Polyangiaceae bacterium]